MKASLVVCDLRELHKKSKMPATQIRSQPLSYFKNQNMVIHLPSIVAM
jgi:hypothetical protein